jgi:uncharacterized protein YgiM (DUF1202 family)
MMRKLAVCGLIAAITGVLALGPGFLTPAPVRVVQANAGTQWDASYFNNTSLSGAPVLTRIDDQINFNWDTGSPDPKVNADNFSARWTKAVNFPTPGKWTFRVGADDGIRMWIDVTPIVDEWHSNPEGFKTYEISIDQLTAGSHNLKVEYYEATGRAGVQVQWWYGGAGGGGGGTSNQYGPATWSASYFNNIDLSGSPVLTRIDNDINFNWGSGSPGTGVNPDNFSVRWTTTFNFPTPGQWHFQVGADDGVRMWVDVTQIINEWHGNPEGYRVYDVDVNSLTAGNHDLKVEYYDASGDARIVVRWWYGTGGAAAAAAPAPTPLPPATPVYAGVTGTNVNVRSGPGLGNPVIAQVNFPKNYRVLGGVADLSWLQIDLGNGTTGWISNEWVWLYSTDDAKNQDTTGGGQPDFVDDIPRLDVAVAPPAEPVAGFEAVVLQGRANDTVRLRDGPSIFNSNIIGAVPQGATFDVEARNSNGSWYLISYRDIRGWVNASYVTLSGGTVNQLVASSEVVPVPPEGTVFVPEPAPGVTVTVRGRASADLRMRDAASLRGNQRGSVPLNAEFVIEGRNTNGAWYLITYEGVEGWVNASYVKLIEGTVPDLPIR